MSFVTIDAGSIAKSVEAIADQLIDSDEEMAEIELRHAKLRARGSDKQMDINLADARSGSFFQAGPRSLCLWGCVIAFLLEVLVFPLVYNVLWFFPSMHSIVLTAPGIDVTQIGSVMMGLLGLSGYRTYEKKKGIDTQVIRSPFKKNSWEPVLPDIKIY